MLISVCLLKNGVYHCLSSTLGISTGFLGTKKKIKKIKPKIVASVRYLGKEI
jgi:hypothetical protein